MQQFKFVFENKSLFDITATTGVTAAMGGKTEIPNYFKFHVRIQASYMGAILYNSPSVVVKYNLKDINVALSL